MWGWIGWDRSAASPRRFRTNEDFLMALSSMESGWLDPHNQDLHNLFGVTKAGGNNLNFPTYQKAADFWIDNFGDNVRGAKTMDDFVAGICGFDWDVLSLRPFSC